MFRKIFLLLSALCVFATVAGAQAPTPTPAAASSANAAAKPERFTPNKAQIVEGQKFLKDKKLYNGAADGKYNDDTRAAIRTFQKDNGLTVSGKFNQATVEKMNIALTDKQKGVAPTMKASTNKTKKPSTPAASDAPKRPAPFTASKDQIVVLQKVLISGKMFSGEANGERSDALKVAITAYQKANSLKETGGINAAVLEKAGIALTDKQKAQVAAQAAYDAAKKN